MTGSGAAVRDQGEIGRLGSKSFGKTHCRLQISYLPCLEFLSVALFTIRNNEHGRVRLPRGGSWSNRCLTRLPQLSLCFSSVHS